MGDDDGRRVIENYLLQVSGNLPPQVIREAVPELRSHLIEEAMMDNKLSVQGARRAVSRMGDPKIIAEEYCREYGGELREGEVDKVACTGNESNMRTRQSLPIQPASKHNHSHHDYPFHWMGVPIKWIWRAMEWTGNLIVKLILFGLLIGAVVSLVASIALLFVPSSYYRQYSVIGGLASFTTLLLICYVLRTTIISKPKSVEGTSRTYEGQNFSIGELTSEIGIGYKMQRKATGSIPAQGNTKASSDKLTDEVVVAEDRSTQVTEALTVRYCPYCGEPSSSDASFCPNCGASIREERSPSLNTGIIQP